MNDGGPAFPCPTGDPTLEPAHGMSLRDFFAAHAISTYPMNDLISLEKTGTELAIKAQADWAYRVADAMLKRRATQSL